MYPKEKSPQRMEACNKLNDLNFNTTSRLTSINAVLSDWLPVSAAANDFSLQETFILEYILNGRLSTRKIGGVCHVRRCELRPLTWMMGGSHGDK